MLKSTLLSLSAAVALMSSAAVAGPEDQEALINSLAGQPRATTLQATTQLQTEAVQCRPNQLNGRWALYVLRTSAGAECFIQVQRGRFTGTCVLAGFESDTSGTLRLTRSCDLSGRFGGPEGGVVDGTLQPDDQSGAALLNNRQSEETESGLMPQSLMHFVRR